MWCLETLKKVNEAAADLAVKNKPERDALKIAGIVSFEGDPEERIEVCSLFNLPKKVAG